MFRMQKFLIAALIVIAGNVAVFPQAAKENRDGMSKTGVLLLAHGGKQNWDAEVMKVAAEVDRTMPAEVAFGMASKRTIQAAIEKLVARGVEKIIAVPLFISSHSTVITSTEFLLGQRSEAPPELAIFAKMDHSGGGHHDHQKMDMSFDPTSPVNSPVPIEMVSALNRHPLVADILLSRAVEVSRDPENEVVVVVAHGPVSDEHNDRWLADIGSLVEVMRGKSEFKRIEYLTVRDDAPEPVRNRATEELRGIVKRAVDEKKKVLMIPLLLAYGGIEDGIKERLDGLPYQMTEHALLPDERLARWVILSANGGNAK